MAHKTEAGRWRVRYKNPETEGPRYLSKTFSSREAAEKFQHEVGERHKYRPRKPRGHKNGPQD